MADSPARRQRLSRSVEFDRVYKHGRSAQHRLLVMYRFERPDDIRGDEHDGACRFGITVSKRVGNSVVRNRLKRQLREALQACTHLDDGFDYVVISRPGLPEAVEANGFERLVDLIEELAGRLHPAPKPS